MYLLSSVAFRLFLSLNDAVHYFVHIYIYIYIYILNMLPCQKEMWTVETVEIKEMQLWLAANPPNYEPKLL